MYGLDLDPRAMILGGSLQKTPLRSALTAQVIQQTMGPDVIIDGFTASPAMALPPVPWMKQRQLFGIENRMFVFGASGLLMLVIGGVVLAQKKKKPSMSGYKKRRKSRR